jgi:predicted nucleic acid-binding protein
MGTDMTSYVLDANILIAISDPANALHHSALTTLASIPHGRTIHPVNLAEVLVGPSRTNQAQQAEQDWTDLGVRTLSGDLVPPYEVATVRAGHAISLPDAYALASASTIKATLVSFDIGLRRAATKAGLAVLPPLDAD